MLSSRSKITGDKISPVGPSYFSAQFGISSRSNGYRPNSYRYLRTLPQRHEGTTGWSDCAKRRSRRLVPLCLYGVRPYRVSVAPIRIVLATVGGCLIIPTISTVAGNPSVGGCLIGDS